MYIYMYIFYYGSITHNITVQHYSINAASRQVVPRERAIRVWYYMVPSL